MLQHEHEQRLRLEEMLEQLAKQHSSLEKHARKKLAAAAGHHPNMMDANQNKGEVCPRVRSANLVVHEFYSGGPGSKLPKHRSKLPRYLYLTP